VHASVFEEFAAIYPGEEVVFLEEKVVFAIDLTRTWRTSGARDGKDGFNAIAHLAAKGGFTCTGGARDDGEDAKAGGVQIHSLV